MIAQGITIFICKQAKIRFLKCLSITRIKLKIKLTKS